MSSHHDFVPSVILSQETREPDSRDAFNSQSQLCLPKLKSSSTIKMKPSRSSTYLKPSDRLYYDKKRLNKYGRINGLLSEVALSLADPVDPEKSRLHASPGMSSLIGEDPHHLKSYAQGSSMIQEVDEEAQEPTYEFDKKPKRVPIKDMICNLFVTEAMKREIMLSKLRVSTKAESVANLKNYIEEQKNQLESQIKASKEERDIFAKFVASEEKKVRDLHDLHLKLDEEKMSMKDVLTKSKNQIIGIEHEIKQICYEIDVGFD